jgi:(4S)-4-hydroxy-5-phosphonooxypentane-2,3-dione isomerase
MLSLLVKVKVKPEERERFLAAIEDDAICSERDEPGCLRFNVLEDQEAENTYYFYEVYRDQEAFEAHQRAPHYARWREAAAVSLDGPSERVYVKPLFPRDPAYWG